MSSLGRAGEEHLNPGTPVTLTPTMSVVRVCMRPLLGLPSKRLAFPPLSAVG
jgi:hypothetical protein